MKKPRKKYRPKPVHPTAIILDRVIGGVTPEEADGLVEIAASALDRCQLATVCDEDYIAVGTAIRTVFFLAAAYENKSDIQALCILAWAGLKLGNGYAISVEMNLDHIVSPKKSHKALAATVAPAQEVLRIFREMLLASPRSEIIKAQDAAKRYWFKIPIQNVAVISDDGFPTDDPLLGERGLAWVHGQCRAGYLDWDDKRLLWRMPKTESQIHITEPTLVVQVPSGTNYLEVSK